MVPWALPYKQWFCQQGRSLGFKGELLFEAHHPGLLLPSVQLWEEPAFLLTGQVGSC
jgi:hypothetical protein